MERGSRRPPQAGRSDDNPADVCFRAKRTSEGARRISAFDGGLNGSAQHSNLLAKMECGHETTTSHYYSVAQRAEIWDRWQAGEPMSSIGRRFDRDSSLVFSVISPTGASVRRIGTVPKKRSAFLTERRFLDGSAYTARCSRSRATEWHTHYGSIASTLSNDDVKALEILYQKAKVEGLSEKTPDFSMIIWKGALCD